MEVGSQSKRPALHLAPLAGRGRIASAIRVRGRFRKRGGNRFKNPRHIEQDVVIPESQNAIIPFDKPFVANHIARIIRVLPAINLDDEPTLPANEVDNIAINRLLPNKFVTTQAARSQPMPQRIFRIGRDAAQASGAARLHLSSTTHAARPPHPDCCAIRPLPARGERLQARTIA
jgi:hypothetical protein